MLFRSLFLPNEKCLLELGSFPPGVLVFLGNEEKPRYVSLCTGQRHIYFMVDTKGPFRTVLLEDTFLDLTLLLATPFEELVTHNRKGMKTLIQ